MTDAPDDPIKAAFLKGAVARLAPGDVLNAEAPCVRLVLEAIAAGVAAAIEADKLAHEEMVRRAMEYFSPKARMGWKER